MAVAVIVDERTAGSPPGMLVPQARLPGDIAESAVAIISIQLVLSVIGAEQIFETVVVVVPNANRRCPPGGTQASLLCHVSESTVTVIPVEPARRALRYSMQPVAIQEKNVHPTVIVIVKESAAAAHRLQNVIFMILLAVEHRADQPGVRGDVREDRSKRAARVGQPHWTLGGSRMRLLAEGGKQCAGQRAACQVDKATSC